LQFAIANRFIWAPDWQGLGSHNPSRDTNFKESKPQQTGTGFLLRLGEAATTSGFTNLIYDI